MLPEELLAEDGWNEAVNEWLCPTPTVRGSERPEMLKPAPEVTTFVIVRSAVPGLETLIDCGALLPTLTLPKLTGEGVTLITGEPVPGVPPPLVFGLGLPVSPAQPAKLSSAAKATAVASPCRPVPCLGRTDVRRPCSVTLPSVPTHVIARDDCAVHHDGRLLA